VGVNRVTASQSDAATHTVHETHLRSTPSPGFGARTGTNAEGSPAVQQRAPPASSKSDIFLIIRTFNVPVVLLV
jgi:hypothetical protein